MKRLVTVAAALALVAPSAAMAKGGSAPAPSPAPASCAKITSFSNISGYAWGSGTEIDTPYSVTSSCSGWVAVDVTYTNELTGAVDLERSFDYPDGTTLASGQFMFAPGPYSTPYTVTLRVTDLFGANVYASAGAHVTTKKPKQAGQL